MHVKPMIRLSLDQIWPERLDNEVKITSLHNGITLYITSFYKISVFSTAGKQRLSFLSPQKTEM